MSRKLTIPFSKDGLKLDISNNTNTDGSVSFQQGFTQYYKMALVDKFGNKTHARQIKLEEFNGILFKITSDIISNSEDVKQIRSTLTKTPLLLDSNLAWSVGNGGNFSKLEDAIFEAAKYSSYGNYRITITLKTGFKITKSHFFKYMDLRHVKIIAEDEWVYFEGNVSTDPDMIVQYHATPFIFGFIYCNAPLISFKLKLNSIPNNETIGFGFFQSPFKVDRAGICNIKNGIWSISSIGFVQNTLFENVIGGAFVADNGSYCNVYHGNVFKNCAGNILWTADGSCTFGATPTFDGIYPNKQANLMVSSISSKLGMNYMKIVNTNSSNSNCYMFYVSGGGSIDCGGNPVAQAGSLMVANVNINQFNTWGIVGTW